MKSVKDEADEYIHLMRQSKMDAIRAYVEAQIKISRRGDRSASLFLQELKYMFNKASNNAPLP